MSVPHQPAQWAAQPIFASAIRLSVLVMPIVVSVVFGLWASRTLPPERIDVNPWLWWFGLIVAATILVRMLDVVLRQLAPLGMLFRLSLVFPDQTPSRFSIALRSGNTTATKKRIQAIQAGGLALNDEDSVSSQMIDLVTTLSKHDRMTRGHSERVRSYSEMIAEEMGITGGSLERLRWGALLHDMGKLEVPSEILNKDGRPSDEEWEILKQHPAAAVRHLEPVAEWLGEWRHAADGHHEKWDGSGYPRGLAGTDIPLSARIVAVADAYDVMTSTRSYKKPLSAEIARREISDMAGTQFDPAVARAFLAISLGDLRRVGGPVAWFASLPAVRQIPIGTVAQPVATGIVATTTAISAAVVGLPEEPTEPPAVVAFADESTTTLPAPEQTVIVTTTVAPVAPSTTPPAPTTTSTTSTTTTTTTTTTLPEPSTNRLPVMVAQTFAVSENTTGSIGDRVIATDPDGPQPLTWTIQPGPHPFDIDPATDELAVAPGQLLDVETAASHLITVTVSDGSNARTTTHTVVISDVDEAPRAQDRTILVSETAPIGEVLGVLTATDPEGRSLEFTLADAAVHPFQLASTDGSLILQSPLDHESQSTHTLSVSASDPGGNSVSFVVEVLVVNADEPPNDHSSTERTTEGGTVVIDIGNLHSDPEGAPISLSTIDDPGTNGTATIVGPNRISYTHNAGETTQDTIRYTVTDDGGLPAAGTIALTIDPINDPPAMSPQTVSIAENPANGSTGLGFVAIDADGPTAPAFTLLTPGTPFALSATGELEVIDADAVDHELHASWPISVEVHDGIDTVVVTHTVVVRDVDEAPTAVDVSATVAEGSDNVINVSFEVDDPEGTDMTITSIDTPGTHGSTTIIAPLEIRYTHDGSETTSDTITYTVSDAGGQTATADIAFTVTPVNDPPQISNQTISLPENTGTGTTGLFVVATDPDGPLPVDLAFTTISNAFSLTSAGEIIVDDQSLLDHETTPSHTIEVSVTDGALTTFADLTILVTDVNEPLTVSGGSASIPEDYTLFDPVFIGNHNDPEDDVANFEILDATNPDADGDGVRAFRILDGLNPGEYRILRWDGDELDFGDNGQTFNLGVRLTDAGGLTADATVTITITSRFELSPFFGDVIISEVNWSQHEAVELYNTTGSAIDVADWIIRDTELGESEPNMINSGFIAPGGAFPIDPDDEAVIWVGAAANPFNHAEDLGASPGVPEIWLNGTGDLLVGVDDLYLYDADERLVAYMAWGDVNCVGCLQAPEIGDQPPITAWSLWDPSGQIPLGTGADVAAGQSISLANYDFPNLSTCWEPTANHLASCTAAEPSQDHDDRVDGADQINTLGVYNLNQAPTGPPLTIHQAGESDANGTLVGMVEVADPDGDPISVSIEPTTNPNLDGDGERAYSATISGTTISVWINDANDVDHGVAGQAPNLQLILDDGNANMTTIEVRVTTITRFGLSPHYGEIIISEVDWASAGAEFVELVNVSGGQVDIANWTISDYAAGVDPADASSFVGTIPTTATAFDPGQRVLFWPDTAADPQTAGIEFEGNQGLNLLRGSDDVWLLDENGRIVAYVAWGTDAVQDANNEIGDRPPITSWGLWDTTHEARLGSGPDVNQAQSIALAIETAASAQNSACWEATTSGDASCAGATTTQNLSPGTDDDGFNRVSSPGRPN